MNSRIKALATLLTMFVALSAISSPVQAAKKPAKPKVQINKPSAPEISAITSSSPKKNKVNLTIIISLPANNGGAAITGSKVSAKGASCSMANLKTTCTIKNVKVGKSFNFVAQSKNKKGFGAKSSPVAFTANGSNWSKPAQTSSSIDSAISSPAPAPTIPSPPIFAPPTVITGTSGDDVLYGTEGDNTIYGLGGNDTIYGLGGNDVIDGGDGDDLIFGDEYLGNYSIQSASFVSTGASNGNDKIKGGKGNDRISSGGGNDEVTGDDGADSIRGGEGADSISGGPGEDRIEGNPGNDVISGGDGNDEINGGDDSDSIDGDQGSDDISGENGNDSLDGGKGVDRCDTEIAETRTIGCDVLSVLAPYFARTSGVIHNWPVSFTECYLVFADYFSGGTVRGIVPIQSDGTFEYDIPPFTDKWFRVMSYGEIYSGGWANADPQCPINIIGVTSTNGTPSAFNFAISVTRATANYFEASLPEMVLITVNSKTDTGSSIPGVSINCQNTERYVFPYGWIISSGATGFGDGIAASTMCRGLTTDTDGQLSFLVPKGQIFNLSGKLQISGIEIEMPVIEVVADNSKSVDMIYSG